MLRRVWKYVLSREQLSCCNVAMFHGRGDLKIYNWRKIWPTTKPEWPRDPRWPSLYHLVRDSPCDTHISCERHAYLVRHTHQKHDDLHCPWMLGFLCVWEYMCMCVWLWIYCESDNFICLHKPALHCSSQGALKNLASAKCGHMWESPQWIFHFHSDIYCCLERWFCLRPKGN